MIWDLPFQTHTKFIESLTDLPQFESVLHNRFLGFSRSLESSNKKHVNLLFSICRNNNTTLTGKNMTFLRKSYDCLTQGDLFMKKSEISNSRVNPINDDELWKISLLKELVELRDGELDSELSEKEVSSLINYVSTS